MPTEKYLRPFLTTLSCVTPLPNYNAVSLLWGHNKSASRYVSGLKKKGWITQRGRHVFLTKKATRLVQENPYQIVKSNNQCRTQIHHETLLARVLFSYLMTLNPQEIASITKEQKEGGVYPDLTFNLTGDRIIHVEIDTGKKSYKKELERIDRHEMLQPDAYLVYYTASQHTYDKLKETVDIHLLKTETNSDKIIISIPKAKKISEDEQSGGMTPEEMDNFYKFWFEEDDKVEEKEPEEPQRGLMAHIQNMYRRLRR